MQEDRCWKALSSIPFNSYVSNYRYNKGLLIKMSNRSRAIGLEHKYPSFQLYPGIGKCLHVPHSNGLNHPFKKNSWWKIACIHMQDLNSTPKMLFGMIRRDPETVLVPPTTTLIPDQTSRARTERTWLFTLLTTRPCTVTTVTSLPFFRILI